MYVSREEARILRMQIEEREHQKLLEREQAAKEGEEMLRRIQELKEEERRKLEAKVLCTFIYQSLDS